MLKRLLAALVLCAVAWPVYGAMNLRQNRDGTADWVGAKATPDNCVGGAFLPFRVQTNNLTTDFGVSPITNAMIRHAWATRPTKLAGTPAEITFWINGQTTTPVRFRSGSTSSRANIRLDAGTWGIVRDLSTNAEAGGTLESGHHDTNTIGRGVRIAVTSNGALTTVATARVILHLCPR